MNPNSSLIDRAGLDKVRVGKLMERGLEGADDGELFLEYKQSEMLVFDNGRLKQATYDTNQGFGLRAVKDEAVGYAHASDVSETAISRAAEAVRAVKGGYSGSFAAPPARTNRKLYGDENPMEAPGFDAKVKLLETIDAYARGKDERVRQVTASLGASWQVVEIVRPDGEIYRDIRPLVRVNVSVVAGSGDRQESGSYGFGGREGYQNFIASKSWQHAVDQAVRQALINLEFDPRSGRRDGRGARPRLARRHAARGGGSRPRGRLQPQEILGLRRPDGPAGRRQGRHRGRRRHHRQPPRLAVDRRRRHPHQPHRADRGRHSGRLHAGPAERAADEHEADRQRAAREPRPRADAAHDQHLHAGWRPRSGRDPRLGEERHLRRQLRRRTGRYHVGQIRVPGHRGLQDRERQARRAAQGRHADRQRPDRPAPHHAWSATTCSSTPASAPAARTARACRSASASRRCAWIASRSAGRASLSITAPRRTCSTACAAAG